MTYKRITYKAKQKGKALAKLRRAKNKEAADSIFKVITIAVQHPSEFMSVVPAFISVFHDYGREFNLNFERGLKPRRETTQTLAILKQLIRKESQFYPHIERLLLQRRTEKRDNIETANIQKSIP